MYLDALYVFGCIYNAILHKSPDSQTYINRILNITLYFILGFKSFFNLIK